MSTLASAINAASQTTRLSSQPIITTINPTTTSTISAPIMEDFLAALHSWGSILLRVPIQQLRPHAEQREVNRDHVESLKVEIEEKNLSAFNPMLTLMHYSWEDLKKLKALSVAPSGLRGDLFDGGHQLQAARELESVKDWVVEVFPYG